MRHLEAYRFFHAHMGGIVGQRAIGAISLARAEHIASLRDWVCEWVFDDDADSSFVETWEPKHQREWEQQSHECLGCVLRDATGEVLGSLWGIWDADNSYRRLVEAELASEALYHEQKAWSVCAHALGVTFLGLEKDGSQWQVRVRHPLWLEGKTLAYPLRMAHTR